jgi:hypothetical protein
MDPLWRRNAVLVRVVFRRVGSGLDEVVFYSDGASRAGIWGAILLRLKTRNLSVFGPSQ